MNLQSDPTHFLLKRVIEATALRHKVLAQNIANVDTPGYVRQDAKFEVELAEAIKEDHLTSFAPKVEEDRSAAPRADGNNVSVERELADMSENALLHQMATQLVQTRLSMQRLAITGHS
ncbi:MAG: flagellar basal body protein [Planctomycetota bacterium]